MRRKLVITCLAVSMMCMVIGCGKSSAELNKAETESEAFTNQETDKQNNSKLEVEEEYKNLPESQGFVFESNGDGTCSLKKIGLCKDADFQQKEIWYRTDQNQKHDRLKEQGSYL